MLSVSLGPNDGGATDTAVVVPVPRVAGRFSAPDHSTENPRVAEPGNVTERTTLIDERGALPECSNLAIS